MIYQLVIQENATSTSTKCYINGPCVVKVLNCYFKNSRNIFEGTSIPDDTFFILESRNLFNNLPEGRLIVSTNSNNDFSNALAFKADIFNDLDLRVLDYDTVGNPVNGTFYGCILTVDITPV